MKLAGSLSFALCMALAWPGIARASGEANLPAQGGASAVSMKVDLASGVVRYQVCPQAPCAMGPQGPAIAITLPPSRLPDPRNVSVERIAIGLDRSAIYAKIPSKDGENAFVVLLVGKADAPVAYAGVTGFIAGEPGSRSGDSVEVFAREDGSRFVVVGTASEATRICSQGASLIEPKILDPASLSLHAAAVQQLSPAQRAAALPITARRLSSQPERPVAPLLSSPTSSSSSLDAAALVDRDLATVWSESRSGNGPGEFASFVSPSDVPLSRVVFNFAPPSPSPTGASPSRFFLVGSHETYQITVPEDAWLQPGASYEVTFPTPLVTSCLSVVLGEAYARSMARPEVSIAEVAAYAELESGGATMATVARALSGEGPRAEAASGLLRRAGARAAAAVTEVYAELDANGRARAIDVLSASECGVIARLLATALGDVDPSVARKARSKLERCGKAAAPALVEELRGTDFAARERVASLLALLAPTVAQDALAGVVAEGPASTRAEVRRALAVALRSASVEKFSALLDASAGRPEVTLDLLRAMEPRLGELGARGSTALSAVLAGDPDFRLRYLALQPLATLSRAHDKAAISLFTAILTHDALPAVRARAAELSANVPEASGGLVFLLSDVDPRVRESAARGASGAGASGGLAKLLEKDPWVFVRRAAADSLAAVGVSAEADGALAKAISTDHAASVRAAAVTSVGARGGPGARGAGAVVRARLVDDEESLDVRIAAARALGMLCDAPSLDNLTALARQGAEGAATEEALALSVAALDGLSLLHPADLAKRLAPLADAGVKAPLRAAATRALASLGKCAR